MDHQTFQKLHPTLPTIPIGPCSVRALYSWSGEEKKDLGFVEGDLIEVLSTGDGDWWTGRLKRNKVVGVFPRNYVEFVNPHQKVVSPAQEICDLGISQGIAHHSSHAASHSSRTSQPLQTSTHSNRSAKSTEEVLKDISMELGSLSLDARPNELDPRLSLPAIDHSFDSVDHTDHNQLVSAADMSFHSRDSLDFSGPEFDTEEPPAPPPHKFLPSNSQTSAHSTSSQPPLPGHFQLSDELMEPVCASPDLDEVPFDPRAFAPTEPLNFKPRASNLTQSSDRARSSQRVFSGSSARSRSVEYFAPHKSSQTEMSSVAAPREGAMAPSSRLVRKIFNRRDSLDNTTAPLQRSASSSSQMSAMSSAFRIRNSLLSPFKHLAKKFEIDGEMYPTHHHTSDNYSHAAERQAATSALLDPKWMDNQRDLYRAKTITAHEMDKRRQAIEMQGMSSEDPFVVLARSATDFHDYRLENFDHVDDAMFKLSTWPQLMTPAVFASSYIGRRFTDHAERLRAVFMLCAAHISHVPSMGTGPDDSDSPAALSRVMQAKRATPQELAQCIYAMCSALDLPCRVVRGHLRQPDGPATGRPHAWNAVQIEGEWRLLDAAAASPTFADSQDGPEEMGISPFYFLCPPQQMLFTHIPLDPHDQHLLPPVPTSTAVTLPIASPAAFTTGAEFVNFLPGILHLSDYEMCELNVVLPNPQLDVVATVIDAGGTEGAAFAQPYWFKGQRQFRIKACLGQGASRGLLQLFAVDRQVRQRIPSNMQLLYSMSLWHRGCSATFEFPLRYATPDAVRHDVYISEPQCRQLGGGRTYTFEFHQHPSRGLTAGSGMVPLRLAVQSPSGRITKLIKHGTGADDTWKATVRTLEVGTWRGVISTDEEGSWAAFGEWHCS